MQQGELLCLTWKHFVIVQFVNADVHQLFVVNFVICCIQIISTKEETLVGATVGLRGPLRGNLRRIYLSFNFGKGILILSYFVLLEHGVYQGLEGLTLALNDIRFVSLMVRIYLRDLG